MTDRSEPTTAAGRRIDAAFAAAAARGDTSASWEDARSWILAIEAEARADGMQEALDKRVARRLARQPDSEARRCDFDCDACKAEDDDGF